MIHSVIIKEHRKQKVTNFVKISWLTLSFHSKVIFLRRSIGGTSLQNVGGSNGKFAIGYSVESD